MLSKHCSSKCLHLSLTALSTLTRNCSENMISTPSLELAGSVNSMRDPVRVGVVCYR